MFRKLGLICLCLSAVLAYSESPASKFQVATIMAVKPHVAETAANASTSRYDVTLKVGNTVYVVLYTPPTSVQVVQYAMGREILVSVGKTTITYNDILGNSVEIPILSRKAFVAQRNQ